MKNIILALALLLCSCNALGGQGRVDLAALADDIDLARTTTMQIAEQKASPELLEKLTELSGEMLKVESALLAAHEDGGITDWKTASAAAFALADSIIVELEASGTKTGDLGFWLALARSGLQELAFGHAGAAAEAIKKAKASAPPAGDPAAL